MFECDVRMTADNVLVLSHNTSITGTVDGVSETLTIAQSTYDDLSRLVLTPNTKYGDVKIPKLADVLKFARHYDMKATLDLKDISDACVEAVVSLVKLYNMSKNILYFTGDNPTVVFKKVIDLDEQSTVVFYYSDDMSYIDDITQDPSRVVISVVNWEENKDAAVAAIRNKGYGLYFYAVNNAGNAALKYLPDYIEYQTGVNVTDIMNTYFGQVKFW